MLQTRSQIVAVMKQKVGVIFVFFHGNNDLNTRTVMRANIAECHAIESERTVTRVNLSGLSRD
jgi:hypothetical protein